MAWSLLELKVKYLYYGKTRNLSKKKKKKKKKKTHLSKLTDISFDEGRGGTWTREVGGSYAFRQVQ